MAARSRSGRRFNRRTSLEQAKSSTGVFEIPGLADDVEEEGSRGVRTRQLWSSDEDGDEIPDISGKVAKKKKGKKSWQGAAGGSVQKHGGVEVVDQIRSSVQSVPSILSLDEEDLEEMEAAETGSTCHGRRQWPPNGIDRAKPSVNVNPIEQVDSRASFTVENQLTRTIVGPSTGNSRHGSSDRKLVEPRSPTVESLAPSTPGLRETALRGQSVQKPRRVSIEPAHSTPEQGSRNHNDPTVQRQPDGSVELDKQSTVSDTRTSTHPAESPYTVSKVAVVAREEKRQSSTLQAKQEAAAATKKSEAQETARVVAKRRQEVLARLDAEREAKAQAAAKQKAIERRSVVSVDSTATEAKDNKSASAGHSTSVSAEYCRFCGKKGEVQFCSKCLSVGYCSAKCQSSDWSRHKKLCKSVTKEKAARAAGQVAIFRPFTAQGGRGDNDDVGGEAWSKTEKELSLDAQRNDLATGNDNDDAGDVEVLYRSPDMGILIAEPVDRLVIEENSFDPMRVNVREVQASENILNVDILPGTNPTIEEPRVSDGNNSSLHKSVANDPNIFDGEPVPEDAVVHVQQQKVPDAAVVPVVIETTKNDMNAEAEFTVVEEALVALVQASDPDNRDFVEKSEPAQTRLLKEESKVGGFDDKDISENIVDSENILSMASDQGREDEFWEDVNRVRHTQSEVITSHSLLTSRVTQPQDQLPLQTEFTYNESAVEDPTKSSKFGVVLDSIQSDDESTQMPWSNRFGVVGVDTKENCADSSTNTRNTTLQEGQEGQEAVTSIPFIGQGTQERNEEDSASVLDERCLGRRVKVIGYGPGTLAYVGPVKFAPEHVGLWLGVVLDEPIGTHDGSVKGTRYFHCANKCGLLLSQRSGQISPDFDAESLDTVRLGWAGSESESASLPPPAKKKGIPQPRRVSVSAAPQELTEAASTTSRVTVVTQPSNSIVETGHPGNDGEMYSLSPRDQSARGPSAEMAPVPRALADRRLTELHEAANTGNLALLKKIVNKRMYPIDIGDREGRTPLMHAIHRVRLECAQYLLSKGANVNLGADDGATPLHEACYNSTLAITQLLLREGADPRATDQDGRQPVHWATDNPYNEKPMCILIDHHRVDVNTVDDAGMTPLMWAACHDNAPMVGALMERGAEMLEKDIDGKTAMDWAVRPDSAAVLTMIVDEPSTYFKDRVGRTVLHTAAERGSLLAIEHILSIRPDAIEDEDRMFRTPLFWAAACNEVAAARLLLMKGADVHKEDISGLTATDYATAKAYDRLAEVLNVHRLNLEQLGMKNLRDKAGVSPIASPMLSIESTPPREGHRVGHEAHLSRSDSLTSLYVTPEAVGIRPKSGMGGSAPSSLAMQNGAGLEVSNPVVGIAKRYIEGIGGLPPPALGGSLRHSDRTCFEAVLHPRGHSLGKIGNNGMGKQVQRYFRIAIDNGRGYLVWSKTQEDLASLKAVMTAGLTTGVADQSSVDVRRFVVHTTVKSLHLVASDEAHRSAWIRALRYLATGET